MPGFLTLALVLYGVAGVAYLGNYLTQGRRSSLIVIWRVVLLTGAVVHVLAVGTFCLEKIHPFSDTSGVLSMASLMSIVATLAVGFRYRADALGALLVPLAIILGLLSGAIRDTGEAAQATAALGQFHLSMVAVGVVCFAAAGGVAVLYLLKERSLRRRQLERVPGPGLATLDDLSRRLVLLGFPVFTLAVITGVVWTLRLPDPTLFRPEYLVSAVIWVVFGFLIVGRWTTGFRGRRAAWATLAGFLCTSLVLAIYIVRRVLAP